MSTTRHPTVRRKRFGQHFLAPSWARKVVAAIAPAPGDVFLEIGPGTGALTMPLAETGLPVLAIEIDRDLVSALVARVPRNVTVLSGNFLEMDVTPFLGGLESQRPPDAAARPPRRLRAVGNLPYNITSPLLFRLIDLHLKHRLLTDATIMVQREVANRLSARPGTKDYGVLTVTAQLHARITKILNLPPSAFSPAPKVESSLVRLTFGEPSARIVDEALFQRLVRALFSQRRKTLRNALKPFHPAALDVLASSGLDGMRRPETLQVSEIARLVELLAAAGRGPML